MTFLARYDVVQRLHQDTHWASRDDAGHLVQHRLDDMNGHHLAAVLRWLRGHADRLHRDQIQVLLRQWRRAGADRDLVEADITELHRIHPRTWLEETALVRRLVQLAPRPVLRPRRRLHRTLRRSA